MPLGLSELISPKSQQPKPLAISYLLHPAFAFLPSLFQLLIQSFQTIRQPTDDIRRLGRWNNQCACINPFVVSFRSTIHNSES